MLDNVIISADSHMTEPPDLWVRRIDKPFRDRAPRVVREYQGEPGHWFVYEGLGPRSVAGTFAAGKTVVSRHAFLFTGRMPSSLSSSAWPSAVAHSVSETRHLVTRAPSPIPFRLLETLGYLSIHDRAMADAP